MTKTALADYESKYCTLSVRNFMSKFASPTVFSLITVTNLQLHPEADTQFVLVTGSDTCILAQESVWVFLCLFVFFFSFSSFLLRLIHC